MEKEYALTPRAAILAMSVVVSKNFLLNALDFGHIVRIVGIQRTIVLANHILFFTEKGNEMSVPCL
jgi:hypothetical protein